MYLREAYGRLTALLSGWTYLIALPAATAATALVFAAYARTFVAMGHQDVRVVAAALVMFIAAINYRSVRVATAIQNVSTGGKMLALLTLAASIFLLGQGHGALLDTARAGHDRRHGTLSWIVNASERRSRRLRLVHAWTVLALRSAESNVDQEPRHTFTYSSCLGPPSDCRRCSRSR